MMPRPASRLVLVMAAALFASLAPAAPEAPPPASPDVPPAAPLPLPALIKQTAPGIVTVVAYNPDLAMPGIGTGFFVAPDRVVTARHVLARVDRAVVRTHGGQSLAVAGILAEDRPSDLVLVQLKRPAEPAKVLSIAPDAPDVGERLFTVSSPLGLEGSASDGIVSAYRDVPGAGVSMQHTVAVSAGSSGCPLVNDRGEVVAVQTGVITAGQKIIHAGQALNFAVSARRIPALAVGKLRTLKECVDDVPPGWKPPITQGIDAISLHPLSREDFRAALEFFRRATREEPDEPDVWFRLALCHEKLGDPAAAIENYAKAVALKPDYALALNNLGATYIRTGQYEQAAEVLRKAVAVKPDAAAAYGNLTVAYVQSKKWKEAADAARMAVRLNPTDAEARLNLGTAAAHLGDLAEARRQQKELAPVDRPRADRLQSLIDERAKSPPAAPQPAAQ